MTIASVLVWVKPTHTMAEINGMAVDLDPATHLFNMEVTDEGTHIYVSLSFAADDVDVAINDILDTFDAPVLLVKTDDDSPNAMLVNEKMTGQFASMAVGHAADVLVGDAQP